MIIRYIILGLILIILILLINNKIYNKIRLLHPSEYSYINEMVENRDNELINNFNKLGFNGFLLNVLSKIRNKINKPIVFGVKKKEDNYRLEIYLYGKNPNNKNNLNIDYIKFNKDLENILKVFNININENINNLFKKYKIHVISFDINPYDLSFNKKLHLYVELLNDIPFDLDKIIDTSLVNDDSKYYTLDYDIINDKIVYESKYIRLLNYDELEIILKFYNINNLIDELKDISIDHKNIMFHYKFYNNSIGIYLFNNNKYNLYKFIKKYNYEKLIFNNKNVIFDIAFNYDLKTKKIISTGFSDFY